MSNFNSLRDWLEQCEDDEVDDCDRRSLWDGAGGRGSIVGDRRTVTDGWFVPSCAIPVESSRGTRRFSSTFIWHDDPVISTDEFNYVTSSGIRYTDLPGGYIVSNFGYFKCLNASFSCLLTRNSANSMLHVQNVPRGHVEIIDDGRNVFVDKCDGTVVVLNGTAEIRAGSGTVYFRNGSQFTKAPYVSVISIRIVGQIQIKVIQCFH